MLAAVRTSFTATLDAGADEALTRWMGALVLVVGAVLTGVLLAVVPPTAEGDWGWIVAAVGHHACASPPPPGWPRGAVPSATASSTRSAC